MTDVLAARELLAAARRRADALSRSDAPALRELLHPEFRWTSHRGDVMGREAYVANNTGGLVRWKRQVLDEVIVSVVEQTGVLVAIVTDEIEQAGRVLTYRMPVTQTWVRRAGQWECLAGHAGPLSTPLDG